MLKVKTSKIVASKLEAVVTLGNFLATIEICIRCVIIPFDVVQRFCQKGQARPVRTDYLPPLAPLGRQEKAD